MANSYYQTITKPKLYVSYPLWQYANGALDYTSSGFISNEDMIKMIQLDPSKINSILPETNDNVFSYKILPQSDDFTDVIDSGLWNFDFCAILGHNFASAGAYPIIRGFNPPSADVISTSNIVNHSPTSAPEYDGWSLFNLDDKPTGDKNQFMIGIEPEGENYNDFPILIGNIMWGRSFTFPQNANLSQTITTDYGVRQKQTITGKTISSANWTKVNNWITEPFGLTEPPSERGDNFQRRSGRRSWKISFDSLAPDKVMNQLMMMNSNGWTAQDNHTTQADGIKSEYNINNAVDFYTNVVHRTMGGHLPMMLQLDADDPSPQNFAIVRMGSKYSITQKSPNLYNISLTLTEQI